MKSADTKTDTVVDKSSKLELKSSRTKKNKADVLKFCCVTLRLNG